MKRIIFLITTLIILLLVNVQLYSKQTNNIIENPQRILATDFPQTASRVMFFEERVNSKDSSVRLRVLVEADYFYMLPDEEYVSFLKLMYKDPDPIVRGRAIKKLYGMWIPQTPSELPLVFSGYSDDRLVNRKSDTTISELVTQTQKGGLYGGYDAYTIGLLRIEQAIPYLKNLDSATNIFVRYTAARALFDCGDISSATEIFDKISSEQLELYKSGKTYEYIEGQGNNRLAEPFYAAGACEGLIHIGGKEKIKGLQRLIELMSFFEKSEDLNDQNILHYVRGILAVESGKYFTSSEDVLEWFKQEQP